MFRYAILCFGGFLFLLLLFIIYNSKPRYLSVENRLFKIVLTSLLICMGLELISYITMYYRNIIPITNEIVCKVAYAFAILYVVAKESYFLSLGYNYKINKLTDLLKVHKKYKIAFWVFSLTLLIFIFLPFTYHFVNDAPYLSGPAYYFVYLYGSVFTIVVLII